MLQYGLPILYALLIWWLSTGLVLFLDNLPKSTFRWSLLGATGIFAGGIYGLAVTAFDQSVTGAYLAFTCSLGIWGWQELTYYTGFLTGPRKHICPPDCSDWQRFSLAIQTSLYHELAVVFTALFIIALTFGAPNQVGTWTFLVLWLMRWSAKLNLFLGVPNLNEEWLPEHLRFLKSYLGNRPINLLFPLSVTAATVVTVLMVRAALASPDAGTAVGLLLVATLLALAVLEHWFLVLPLPDAALWHWAIAWKNPPPSDATAGSTDSADKQQQTASEAVPAPQSLSNAEATTVGRSERHSQTLPLTHEYRGSVTFSLSPTGIEY